jgi:hypothetical protein
MSNPHDIAGVDAKPTITRKQFLATLGIALIGLVIPSAFLARKKMTVADASYGNNTYGGNA